jgi:hypothetical protein
MGPFGFLAFCDKSPNAEKKHVLRRWAGKVEIDKDDHCNSRKIATTEVRDLINGVL